MRERRFLVRELTTASEVEIRGSEAHHLLHVLRLRPGDEVVVFDGRGHQNRAVLTRCEASSATARKLEPVSSGSESPLGVAAAVAAPKGDGMSLIVQKLTELGVQRVTPLVSDRTSAKSKDTLGRRVARWRRIAGEAAKQSGRTRVPEIGTPLTFDELITGEQPSVRILACPGGASLPNVPRPRSCLVVIGPEGGWTDNEVSAAVRNGFFKFGLGPRILRTETAAIAAAAILQWVWGDAQTDESERGAWR
jgi:16S rRNA (uracil1498-N3)-methyltransferase